MRHVLIGPPVTIIAQAFDALEMADIGVLATSSIKASKPIGPSRRQYANAVAVIITALTPSALLARLKMLEAHFGRRGGGQRWAARSLDIDIILWSGGRWTSSKPNLTIPHREWRYRYFVLEPAAEIAPNWRDPGSGCRIKHVLHRMKRANRLDPRRTGN